MTKEPSGFNGLIAGLLRSPLHGLLSGNTMLITVAGRKSGNRFTTPVNYVRQGDTLWLISQPGRTWWKNLDDHEPGTPVTLLLKGKEVRGRARLIHDPDQVVATLRRMRPNMADDRLHALAAQMIAITVEISGDAAAPA